MKNLTTPQTDWQVYGLLSRFLPQYSPILALKRLKDNVVPSFSLIRGGKKDNIYPNQFSAEFERAEK
jgi:hypothetical protein